MTKICVVADIGVNHNGNVRIACNLIDAAKRCGADIAKFQLYDVDKLFTPEWPWYKIVKSTQLTYDQVKVLSNYCTSIGIEFMASVFDVERVDWCKDLVKRYKIASRSIYDKPLIEAICCTGRPIIASLGMWPKWYIPEFPDIKTSATVDYLYCVSKYPTKLTDLAFDQVDFNKISGFSDHTIGITASLVAASLGARIIEKHLTFNRYAIGPDHLCSADPYMLRHLIRHLRDIEIIRR